MHIVHVITRLILGGAQENTLLTVTGLVKKGHRAEVITGPEIDWKFVNSYVPRFPVRVCPFLVRNVSPFEDVLALSWLTGTIGGLRPDVVHTHSAKAGVLGRLACGISGVPAVHTVHGLPYHSTAASPIKFAYDAMERLAGRFTRHFIAVGKEMQAGAQKYAPAGIGCTIVRSGVPVRDYEHIQPARQKFGIPAGVKVIGMLTRIAKQKGVDHALFMMSRMKLPDEVLAIAGDGPLNEQMRRFARDIGVSNKVLFVGRIEPAEVPQFLGSIDVFLHCSLREGLPRACVQALLCGVPVIAYNVEGITDIVNDGVNGFIVSQNNIMDLEIRITQCLMNLERFKENVLARRQTLLHEFDSEKMVEQIRHIYECVV